MSHYTNLIDKIVAEDNDRVTRFCKSVDKICKEIDESCADGDREVRLLTGKFTSDDIIERQ